MQTQRRTSALDWLLTIVPYSSRQYFQTLCNRVLPVLGMVVRALDLWDEVPAFHTR